MDESRREELALVRARDAIEQACRNLGVTDPEVARHVAADTMCIDEGDVAVVRVVDHEGVTAVLVEVSGHLLALSNGLDSDQDAHLYLIVACPVCGALVSQGDYVFGRSMLLDAIEDPPARVRYHRAEGSGALKLLQSMTERLTYSGRSVGGTLCTGSRYVGPPPSHPEVAIKRPSRDPVLDGGSARGAQAGAELTAAGWHLAEISTFFAAIGVLENKGWQLVEPVPVPD
jgi:hypothetical protein